MVFWLFRDVKVVLDGASQRSNVGEQRATYLQDGVVKFDVVLCNV